MAHGRSSGTLWTRFTRWFFSNFFRLLLFSVSLSEWAVLWWVVGPYVDVPWPAHLVGPLLIDRLNRRHILRTRQPGRSKPATAVLSRLYYASAFTCVFCGFFLLLNAVFWTTLGSIAGLIAGEAQGLGTAAGLHHGVDAVSRFTGSVGLALIGFVFAYGYTIGQRRLRVATLRLPLAGMPEEWKGLRIAQISDIHIGQNLDAAQLERFVARVNDVDADLLCITGDIADNASTDMERCFPILAGLRARYGVFAILGNHDHYAGADRVADALARLTPFTVLRDASARVEVRGRDLQVIGLDDRGSDWARGLTYVPQLDQILATLPAGDPAILLCHRPDVFEHAAAVGVALTLSGHTHGGQLALPWFGGRYPNLSRFITTFDRGLFEKDGAYLYVNCGLGVTAQRIRLSTPREISVIEVA